ncbi:MAG: phosphate acyltransferase PlsX [Candidatus Aquirickettsiella gammari]|jgi:glycerol-3-phosphate acyltransferase PlsX|uniref:Phosphate acyltransferase n=1 Tax=Candidatus Aquirickettsiella gammari TaxID=2016198 RepID=A0A370CJ65_9COXI|nr:MAG: phosphate acyltransferase PlsX [Candidatus Aquirickettsiella gammari]
MSPYTLAIDAMGGDYGPSVTVPAVLLALQEEPRLHIILVGDLDILQAQLKRAKTRVKPEQLTLHAATQIVSMDEPPALALRNKKDSSMRVAINLVKEGLAQACVSAGNTGALMATARFVLKTIPGIDRPAISAMLPTMKEQTKVRVLDLGANVDSEVEHLLQFAIMGSVLSAEVDNIKSPRVALLNIGSEEIKGNEQVKKAAELLKNAHINYIGYIEGDAIYQGIADVIVCDGFVGNVALKVTEGVAKLVSHYIKLAFNRNWFSRLSGLMALHVLKGLRNRLDPARYNGASLIGLRGIVIKSHGSASVLAFKNAINEAIFEVEKNIPERIREQVTGLLKESEQSL